MTDGPPVSRRDLLTAAIEPGLSIGTVEIKEVTMAPRQPAPLHLHPCPVVGVVMGGRIAYQIEGELVRHLAAGDAFYEPAGARVARFDNEGDALAVFTAFYLLGEGEDELTRVLDAQTPSRGDAG